MRMIIMLLGLFFLLTALPGASHARSTPCELSCQRQFDRVHCYQLPWVCRLNRQNCILRCARMPR